MLTRLLDWFCLLRLWGRASGPSSMNLFFIGGTSDRSPTKPIQQWGHVLMLIVGGLVTRQTGESAVRCFLPMPWSNVNLDLKLDWPSTCLAIEPMTRPLSQLSVTEPTTYRQRLHHQETVGEGSQVCRFVELGSHRLPLLLLPRVSELL